MKRRDLLVLGSTIAVARALAPRAAFAQSKYPQRPIRLVVPFPPGGAFDSVARPWADKMTTLLGTVVVENQGGGGSSLGGGSIVERNLTRATIFIAVFWVLNTFVLLKI